MTKKIIVLLMFGLILRLVLMFTTFHLDIRGHNLAAYLISQKGEVLTFYDYISRLPRTHRWVEVYRDNLFIYPPLSYLTLSAFMKVLGPIYPWNTFFALIHEVDSIPKDYTWLLLKFLLKFPYLVIEGLGICWLIKKVDLKARDKFILGLALNVPVLFSAYMMGQFDVIIAILIAVSAIASLKKPTIWSAVLLGVAAGFKPFPLLLLPLLGEGIKDKLKYVLIGVATYILIIFPYLGSAGFRRYALLASQTDKIEFAKILVSGSQYLALFWVLSILLWWWNWYDHKRLTLVEWYLAGLLVFYSVTHFHPQWFTWGSLLIVWIGAHKKELRLPLLVLVLSFVALLMLFEPSLNFGLFGVKFDLFATINKHFPADQFASILRSLFAATGIVTILRLRKS